MRHLTIDVLAEKRFRLRGTEAWATEPADAWLCAHDILHHQPTDTGLVHEELMTFGVELWMEFPVAGLNAVSWDNLSGVLTDAYRTAADLPRFVVPAVSQAHTPPSAEIRTRFEELVELGTGDFLDTVQDRHEDEEGQPIPYEWVEAIAGAANRARMVDWMCFGYQLATKRYPDQDKALILFRQLAQALSRHKGLQPLELTLDEANYCLC